MKATVTVGAVSIMMVVLTSPLSMMTEIAHCASTTIQHTYSFSIAVGDYWNMTSELDDDLFGSTTGTGYADKYILRVTGRARVKIEVVDAAPSGDTMVLVASPTKHWSAISPDTVIILTPRLEPRIFTFYVCYALPNTGLFPATYSIHVAGFKW